MFSLEARKVKLAAGGFKKVWYIRGKCPFSGDQIRVSTRCDRKSDAEAALEAFKAERRQSAITGVNSSATFAEAIEEYLRKGGEARYLHPLNAAFGEWPLTKITAVDLSKRGAEAYPNAKLSTLRRQWYVPFQAVWNAAVRGEMAPEKTWAKPVVPRSKAKYPTDDWLSSVLNACTTLPQRAALLYMSFSGARAAEVVAVKVRDFDPVAARITLDDTKNDDGRTTVRNPTQSGQ